MAVTPPRPISEFEFGYPDMPPFHIALILDGQVKQVMHVDEKMAAVILSNPLIVQTDHPMNGGAQDGWTYDEDTETFSPPAFEDVVTLPSAGSAAVVTPTL
jgi:hypothetical protein